MKGMMITGLVLFVFGIEALFYGGFSYIVDKRNDAKAGIGLSAKQRHAIEPPLYGGAAGVAVGGLMLLAAYRKQRPKR